MNEENIATRLKFLIEKLQIKDSQFADQCSISRSTLSLFLSGKNKKPSTEMITQIHHTFPNLSINWLMFGEEPMWINGEKTTLMSSSEISEYDNNDTTHLSNIFNPENLTAENGKFPYHSLGINEKIDSGAPTYDQIQTNTTDYKSNVLNNGYMNEYIQKNIEIKKRRVSHVTIYYDDSTFETFYPK